MPQDEILTSMIRNVMERLRNPKSGNSMYDEKGVELIAEKLYKFLDDRCDPNCWEPFKNNLDKKKQFFSDPAYPINEIMYEFKVPFAVVPVYRFSICEFSDEIYWVIKELHNDT